MNNIIEVKNISKIFTGFEMKNISFNLHDGFIMGLIGPNGAGKTTLLKIIMNLIKPDEGEVKIFNQYLVENEIEIKNMIGFVQDVPIFYNHLTIEKFKKIISKFYINWDNPKFYELLERFKLSKSKKIGALSRGMKEKLALSIALSHKADLIILDEPTSGLDPVSRSDFLDILYDLIQDDNKSVIFSTHITSDLEKIADYITFINDGELVFSKTKDELMTDWTIVKGGNDLLTPESKQLFKGVRTNEFGFEALASDKFDVKSYFGDEVVFEKPSLEDIMFYITRG